MTFKDYLQSKKIDPKAFALSEAERFREYKQLFDQLHPDSFTAQKLFVINRIRRNYPLAEVAEPLKKELRPGNAMKPKVNIPPKR